MNVSFHIAVVLHDALLSSQSDSVSFAQLAGLIRALDNLQSGMFCWIVLHSFLLNLNYAILPVCYVDVVLDADSLLYVAVFHLKLEIRLLLHHLKALVGPFSN